MPTGSARANPTSAVSDSSAGISHRPRRCLTGGRAAGCPARLALPRPLARASAASTTIPSTTRMSDSPAAVARSTCSSVKISVVKVRKSRISNAPNSANKPSMTKRHPPRTVARIWGSTTLAKVRHGPTPRARDVSSNAGSVRRNAAATGRNTRG